MAVETKYKKRNDECATPNWILRGLFDDWYDPCPLGEGLVERDGLYSIWFGEKIFINPPYSNPKPWVERAIAECKQHKKTVACCCGHGVYPETIVFEDTLFPEDYEPYIYFVKTGEYSSLYLPRTRKFYKQDADGFFYIPEIVSSEERSKTK